MAGITITDKGTYIEIDNLDGTTVELLKPYDIEIFQGYLNFKNEIDTLKLKYTDITTPSSVDIDDLRDILMQYNNVLPAPPLPVGISTEAKQDAEILLLTNQLDISISKLRDDIRGAGNKDFTTEDAVLQLIKTASETTAGLDFATEVTLASVLAKIIAAPATEAKQDTIITALGTLLTTAAFQARINTLGQKTMANSTPMVFASDQSAIPVSTSSNATGTFPTPITAAVVDTLIIASNANRKGLTIFNNSTAILYLMLSTTAASTSNYSVQLQASGYYEVPFNYTGQIRGIWSAANGFANLTEITV